MDCISFCSLKKQRGGVKLLYSPLLKKAITSFIPHNLMLINVSNLQSSYCYIVSSFQSNSVKLLSALSFIRSERIFHEVKVQTHIRMYVYFLWMSSSTVFVALPVFIASVSFPSFKLQLCATDNKIKPFPKQFYAAGLIRKKKIKKKNSFCIFALHIELP